MAQSSIACATRFNGVTFSLLSQSSRSAMSVFSSATSNANLFLSCQNRSVFDFVSVYFASDSACFFKSESSRHQRTRQKHQAYWRSGFYSFSFAPALIFFCLLYIFDDFVELFRVKLFSHFFIGTWKEKINILPYVNNHPLHSEFRIGLSSVWLNAETKATSKSFLIDLSWA